MSADYKWPGNYDGWKKFEFDFRMQAKVSKKNLNTLSKMMEIGG